jgi:PAS domain S-box-containing protein
MAGPPQPARTGLPLEAFRRLLQAAPSAVAITSMRDSRFVDANDEMLEALGYAREDLIGRTPQELGIWRAPQLAEVGALLRSQGRARRVPVPFHTKGGQARHFLANFDVVVLDGEPCILSACVDVTEMREEAERIRASEERFRRAFDDAPIGMVVFDGKGTYLQVNRAFAQMLGVAPEDVVGRDWKEYTHPDDIAPVTSQGQAVGSGRAPSLTLEKRYLRPDGATVWAELTSSALRDAEGKVSQFVTQVQDVTEARKAREALRGQTMTRELVRQLLVGLIHRGKVSEGVVRDMGRDLAREHKAPTLAEALDAFQGLGFGSLRVVKEDGRTYTFAGRDLLERRTSSARPTCYLALSYLEGTIASVTGAAASLGSEIRCQSQGHEECQFVVVRRDGPV